MKKKTADAMNAAMDDAWKLGVFSTRSKTKAFSQSRKDAEEVAKDPKVKALRAKAKPKAKVASAKAKLAIRKK